MKKTIKLFLAIIAVIMTFNISFSQDSLYLDPRYTLYMDHATLVNATTYEFEIYLRQLTSSRDSTVMLYGSCQYFLNYDTTFRNGGTMTVSMVSSDLTTNLRPNVVASPPAGQLRFAANLPSSPSTTDTVKWLTPGTMVAKIRLTNSVPFNSGVDIKLRWRNRGHGNPYTKITVFTGNDNVTLKEITDSLSHVNPPTGIEPNTVVTSIPNEFNLSQNYPNPFNPTTKIEFAIPVEGKVNMRIYDITGREMMNLVNEVKPAGFHTVNFNGANFASGIYFYRIEVTAQGQKKYEMTKRMVLIK